MQVGDRVRLYTGSCFKYGQGHVSHDEVGVVIKICDSIIDGNRQFLINFPSSQGWCGLENELIIVESPNLHIFNEKMVCKYCGKVIGEGHTVDSEYICHDCFIERYRICDDCGKVVLRDELVHVKGVDKYVCENCLRRTYEKCEDCGEWFYPGRIDRHYTSTGLICDSCYRNHHWKTCYECGRVFKEDKITRFKGHDYCEKCYEEIKYGRVYDYHEFRDWELFKGENEENPPYYIGSEIELEPLNYPSNEKGVLKAIYNNINAVGMHDGSLDCGGVEVVTHPESWEYKKEHKEDYKNFFDDIQEIEYGDNGSCGLHFHVTRPDDDTVARIIVLIESFKDEIKRLSRRSQGELDDWAKFLTDYGSSDNLRYRSKKHIKEEYLPYSRDDRYKALNLCNSRTIEFRFFNGVDNFQQYWAALEFIHNLVEMGRSDKDLNTINWKDLINGEELQKEAKRLGISNINKFAKDTTDILEHYDEVVEKTKVEIKRILKNMARYVNREILQTTGKRFISSKLEFLGTEFDELNSSLNYKVHYLQRILNLYNNLSSYSIDNIKYSISNIKSQFPLNSKKCDRHNKQIDKVMKDFEKEVR